MRPGPLTGAAEERERWLALGLCGLAFGLRLYGLTRESLWVDEAFTVANARRPLAEVWTARVDVHPPLYTTLMHLWLPLAGAGEFSLRYPSVLAGVLLVPALFAAGRALGRRGLPGRAALLAALAPLAIWVAQDGRNYALLLTAVGLGLATTLRVLAGTPAGAPGRWQVGATLLALLTNHSALSLLLAQQLGALGRLRDRAFRRPWLVTQGVTIGVFGLWAGVFLLHREYWQGLFWLPWTRTTPLGRLLVDWAAGYSGWLLGMQRLLDTAWGPLQWTMAVAIALVGLLTMVGLAVPGLDWSRRLFLLTALLLPVVAVVVADRLNPNYHLRFTLAGYPVLLLLLARGLAAVAARRLWLGRLALGALVGLWAAAYQVYLTTPLKEDWRSAVRFLARESRPGDVVLAALKIAVDYYYTGPAVVYQLPPPVSFTEAELVARLDAMVNGAERVWLIPAENLAIDPQGFTARLLTRHARARHDYQVGLPVSRFDLPPGTHLRLGPPLVPIDALFEAKVRLIGYAVADSGPGRALQVVTVWRLERPLDEDLKVFVHLHDERGQTVAQQDPLFSDLTGLGGRHLPVGREVWIEALVPLNPAQRCAVRRVAVGLYRPVHPYPRLVVSPPESEQRVFLPVPATLCPPV